MRRGTTLSDLMQWDNTLFEGIIIPEEVHHGTLVSSIMLNCGLMEVLYQDYDVFKSHVHVWFAAHQWNIEKLVNLIKQNYEPLWNYNKYEELSGNKNYDGTKTTNEQRDTDKTGNVTTTIDHDKSVNDQYGGADTMSRVDTFGEVNGRNLATDNSKTTTNNLQTNTTTGETETTSGTTTKSVTAFNTDAWQPVEKVEESRNRQLNGTETETKTGTVTEVGTVDETGETTKTGSNQRQDTETFGKTLDTTTDEQVTEVETHNTHEDRDTTGSELDKNTTTTTESNHIYGNVGLTTYQKMFFEEFDVLDGINLYDWIVRRFTNDLMVGVYI